ncbi:unnamed protein product [Trichogramma brassicae]|uniref:Uncharacterized protein n=1 Tax=Trichogramma brassicae TaxID=86971 RepID=A0A6H5I637_9HYME|nr:unnamed protein product [Trichogramma brassicae]
MKYLRSLINYGKMRKRPSLEFGKRIRRNIYSSSELERSCNKNFLWVSGFGPGTLTPVERTLDSGEWCGAEKSLEGRLGGYERRARAQPVPLGESEPWPDSQRRHTLQRSGCSAHLGFRRHAQSDLVRRAAQGEVERLEQHSTDVLLRDVTVGSLQEHDFCMNSSTDPTRSRSQENKKLKIEHKQCQECDQNQPENVCLIHSIIQINQQSKWDLERAAQQIKPTDARKPTFRWREDIIRDAWIQIRAESRPWTIEQFIRFQSIVTRQLRKGVQGPSSEKSSRHRLAQMRSTSLKKLFGACVTTSIIGGAKRGDAKSSPSGRADYRISATASNPERSSVSSRTRSSVATDTLSSSSWLAAATGTRPSWTRTARRFSSRHATASGGQTITRRNSSSLPRPRPVQDLPQIRSELRRRARDDSSARGLRLLLPDGLEEISRARPGRSQSLLRDKVPATRRYTWLSTRTRAANSSEGLTSLHVVCANSNMLAESLVDVCDVLNRPLRLEVRDRSNRTPLFYAAHERLYQTVESLLRRGAIPRVADADGSTPLHVICQRCAYDDNFASIFLAICDEIHRPVRLDARDERGPNPASVRRAEFRAGHRRRAAESWRRSRRLRFSRRERRLQNRPLYENELLNDSVGTATIPLRADAVAAVLERLENGGYELDLGDTPWSSTLRHSCTKWVILARVSVCRPSAARVTMRRGREAPRARVTYSIFYHELREFLFPAAMREV